MLARRPYAIAEMRQALEKKFSQKELVSEAIARLRELGYLDDRKFAEQYAYSLAQNRGYGPHRLRRELRNKRVNFDYIEPAVAHAYEAAPPQSLLDPAHDKKLRGLRLPLSRARVHSLCQSLMRLGFNAGDIIKAVRARPELTSQSDDIEPVDLEGGNGE